jgi:predicted acetylornithine/succinylornithine family transaminase
MVLNSEYYFEREKKYHLGVYRRSPVVFVSGEGPYLFDLEGEKYLDFLAGIAVNVLGYSFPPLVKAIQEEAAKLLHTSNLFYTLPQIELAERLIKISGLSKAFFVNSGAEANEVAMKVARFYGRRKHKKRFKFISFERSFHGRTLLTLAATGQKKFHQDLEPLPLGIAYAKLNDLQSVLEILDDEVCAIIVEPVQGEGGVYPSSKEFLQGLRELCDREDILLIFDEVQCGMGRTGSFFAFQHFGVKPDLVTLAKGLGGGLPIGCCLLDEKVLPFLHPGDQGSTFGGNPVCARSACVVCDEVSKESFLKKVGEKGDYLKKELEGLQKKYPGLIKEVRGVGLMWGIEIPGRAKEAAQKLFESKVLVNACNDDVVRLLPPLIIEEEHIDLVTSALDKILATW